MKAARGRSEHVSAGRRLRRMTRWWTGATLRMSAPFAAAICVLGSGAAAPSASAGLPGTNGRIVFTVLPAVLPPPHESLYTDISTVQPDGSDLRDLTPEALSTAQGGVFSPDGTTIAFSQRTGSAGGATREIFVMNELGSSKTNVTRFTVDGPLLSGDSVAWSPDRTRMIMVRSLAVSIGNEVYALRADGTGRALVRPADGLLIASPRWSPDGTRILFAGGRSSGWAVYTMAPNGTGQRALTEGFSFYQSPDWSPDGTRIVFAGRRTSTDALDLYVMNADGSNVQAVTKTPENETSPVWSPDGAKIAFTSDVDDKGNVYVMNSDGTGATRVTSAETREIVTDWQPFNQAPALTAMSIAPTSFPSGRTAVVQFTSSEPGTTEIAYARRELGRTVTDSRGRTYCTTLRTYRGSLVLPPRTERCWRYLSVGNAQEACFAGLNNVVFRGELAGKALTPGTYRATVRVFDGWGKRSEARNAIFTILAP